MIAVVREQEPALLDEQLQLGPFLAAEPDQFVTGHEKERKRQQIAGVGGDHDLFRVDGYGRVFHQGIEDVGGDLGVVVPVARVVPQAREDELGGLRPAAPGRPETIPSAYLNRPSYNEGPDRNGAVAVNAGGVSAYFYVRNVPGPRRRARSGRRCRLRRQGDAGWRAARYRARTLRRAGRAAPAARLANRVSLPARFGGSG